MFEIGNAFLPGMIELGGGVIVNITSVTGLVAPNGEADYTARSTR